MQNPDTDLAFRAIPQNKHQKCFSLILTRSFTLPTAGTTDTAGGFYNSYGQAQYCSIYSNEPLFNQQAVNLPSAVHEVHAC